MQIDVKIIGLNRLMSNFKRAPQLVKSEVNKAIRAIGVKASQESKSVTPVRTGALKGSIRPSFSNFRTIIQPHKFYGIYVHEGWGMRSRPFLEWGLKKSIPFIDAEVKRTGDKILNKISKI